MSKTRGIHLDTLAGELKLTPVRDYGQEHCIAHEPGHTREAGLVLEARTPGRPPARLPLCGDCVAEAFAILLGRRHVQAGGALSDLAP